MKALTLYQSWAWAVASGQKDVENRTWKPRGLTVGDLVAIHASRRPVDWKAAGYLEVAHGCHVPEVLARGAVVGVCTYGGLLVPQLVPRGWHEAGYVGWFLTCQRLLAKPVACRGAQGLWTLPADVEAVVRRQLEEK